jgi:hypothetical protein
VRYVEARGRKNALVGTILLVLCTASVLGLAAHAAYRGAHDVVPTRWSAAVLLAGGMLLLVVLLRMSIQSLEVAIRPLATQDAVEPSATSNGARAAGSIIQTRHRRLRLVEGTMSGLCAVGDVALLLFAGSLLWALGGAEPSSWLLTVIVVLVAGVTLVGLVAAALAVFRLGRHLRDLDGAPEAGGPPDPLPDADEQTTKWGVGPGGEMICCSGGGIRSASFCMGALQHLAETGRYQRAKAVFAVSGGSWTAAAFHAVHRQLDPDQDVADQVVGTDPAPDLFALNSPELRRFRRDTRYLASSSSQRLRMALAFVFGTAINLSLVLAAMRLAAWFIGWIMAASGTLALNGATLTIRTSAAWTSPLWLGGALLLGSLATFVLARLVDSLVPFAGQSALSEPRWNDPQVPRSSRLAGIVRGLDRATAPLVSAGAFAMLVWPGIPVLGWGLDSLGRRIAHLPVLAGVVSTVASWMNGPAAVAGVVSAAVAFAGLVRAAVKGQADARPTTRRAVLRVVRVQLAPWLGSGLVLGGGYLLLSVWSQDYARGFLDSAGPRGASPVDGLVIASAVTVLVLSFFTSANFTTLYAFFRDSLAEAYLMSRSSDGTKAHAMKPQDVPTFSALGRYVARDVPVTPALVMCATANVSDRLLVPAGRRATSFLFTSAGIGLPDRQLPERGRRLDPEVYEGGRRRDTSLAAAMAISGAAVAPVAGRESNNVHPYRLLMALANLRLGVWLKNPYWVSEPDPPGPMPWRLLGRLATRLVHRRNDSGDPPQRVRALLVSLVFWFGDFLSAPGPGMILREGLGRTSLYSRYLYVTDGGHLDNLGMVEALRQRPEQLIVLDASADKEDTFITLASAIATARMDLGIEVSGFNLKSATRGDLTAVRQAWTVGSARYPDGATCRIVYIKALYVEDATLDLTGYKSLHPEFPLTGTTDQLYDEFDLEAFRQLGYFITRKALHGFAELQPRSAAAPNHVFATPGRR